MTATDHTIEPARYMSPDVVANKDGTNLSNNFQLQAKASAKLAPSPPLPAPSEHQVNVSFDLSKWENGSLLAEIEPSGSIFSDMFSMSCNALSVQSNEVGAKIDGITMAQLQPVQELNPTPSPSWTPTYTV